MRKIIGLTLMAGFLLLGSAGSAQAATPLGQNFAPADPCSGPATFLQLGSPGNSYAAPTAGVITSWRFQPGSPAPTQVKLKIARNAGGTNFTIVGESTPQAPVANVVNSYPTRISVQSGDYLGFYVSSNSVCATNSVPGYTASAVAGDAPLGTTTAPIGTGSAQLSVSATLEGDIDGDGFGDETQDQCPTNATTQGPCPPPPPPTDTTAPETKIESGLVKTDKPKVKFGFSSNEPGSTFQCRLTGKKVTKIALKTYNPCTSPKVYKRLKPGKYKFFVFATDAAGNVDPTPVVQKFRVVE